MIQANELRIGSIFNWNESIAFDGGTYGLQRSHFWIAKEYDINIEDCVEGVRLTPDILVKMGFEPSDDGIYIKDNICIRHYILSFAKVDFDNKGVRHFRTYISFVHQLQNLYFALTGEELPVDLTLLQ